MEKKTQDLLSQIDGKAIEASKQGKARRRIAETALDSVVGGCFEAFASWTKRFAH